MCFLKNSWKYKEYFKIFTLQIWAIYFYEDIFLNNSKNLFLKYIVFQINEFIL